MNAMRQNRQSVVTTIYNPSINKCGICGRHPVYGTTPCSNGRYTLFCPNCNSHPHNAFEDNLLKPAAERLALAWNDMTVDGVFTKQASYRGYKGKIDTGSLALIKSLDSFIEDITDDLDVLLTRLKSENEKGINVDYDICQFVPTEEGFVLQHVTTSRICVYLMCGKMPDDAIEQTN